MTRGNTELDPRAVRQAEQLAEKALAEPLRPLPRRVQDVAVAVAIAATVLAVVFRLIGGDAASWYLVVCSAALPVLIVVGLVLAVRRRWIDWWGPMVASPLGRPTARRIGAAAVGRASVPEDLDTVVLGTAHKAVRGSQWQVFLLTGLVLLEAGNGARDDTSLGAWSWAFIVLAALITAALVWTIRRERAAGEVLLAGRIDQPE